MAWLYDGIEEAAFKRVDGGYVFRSPNRWFFGRSHNYLVNEAQKIAIAGFVRETLREFRPVVVAAMLIMPLLVAGGAFLLVARGRATPVAVVVLTLAVFGPYVGLMHFYCMRKLRPLIADLPRTSERFTLREGTANFVSHMSSKLLLSVLCCMSLCLIGNLMMLVDAFHDGRLVRSLVFLSPGAILSGLAVAYFGKTMVDRANPKVRQDGRKTP